MLDLIDIEAAKAANMQKLGCSGKVQRSIEGEVVFMNRRGLSLGIRKQGIRSRELGLKCLKDDDDDDDIGGTACALGTSLNLSQQRRRLFQLSLLLPTNPLRGSLASELMCEKCTTSKPLNIAPFVCLPLPLPLNSPTSLKECLRLSSGPETVDGIKCGTCVLQDEILRSVRLC